MEHDRNAVMSAFASDVGEQSSIMTREQYASPVQMRPVGAQAITVKRDPRQILQQIRTFAQAAGEAWYYSWDVKDKQSRRKDGKTTIEGPSVKMANDLARLYGNCSVGIERVEDAGKHWVLYARFVDYETGYEYTRPFQQRKNQGEGHGTQADRQTDIAFQIGSSKAIRNCVVNSLGTFIDFAMGEAKSAIIDRVGKDLDRYRVRVINRLEDLGVDLNRIERLIGKANGDWDAKAVAKLIAEIQAIGEGMTTPEEIWPVDAPKDEPPGKGKLEDFAGGKDAITTEAGAGAGNVEAAPQGAGGGADAKGGTEPAAAGGAVVDKPAVAPKPKAEKPAAAKAVPAKDAAPAAVDKPAGHKANADAVSDKPAGDAFPGDTPIGGDLSGSDKSAEQIARNKADTIAARPKVDAAGAKVPHDPQTGLVQPDEVDDIPAFLRRSPSNQARGISQDPENREPPADEPTPPHEDRNQISAWHKDKPPAWIDGYIARSKGEAEGTNPYVGANEKISNAWKAGWYTRDGMDDVMPL